QVLTSGLIKNPNFLCEINVTDCLAFVAERIFGRDRQSGYDTLIDQEPKTFIEELEELDDCARNRNASGLFQVLLNVRIDSVLQLQELTAEITKAGGEGVMLRS